MIPRTCKRLIEVDFPIAEVSKHSAREKSIRHGHPSTLHLWWARRPLAACRAVLLGLLLPDPCDPDCPPEFKPAARAALAHVPNVGLAPDDEGLREALLRFIGDFANWDLSSNAVYLKAGRDLVKAAHGEEPPLVVDPFAGGGSIPLEALRLGCDAFASDLNPVACLIQKVLLEDIPRHGPELADELRKAGAEIKKKAEEELREFYPEDPDGSRPIAYLWARTVRCESPNCGCEIPLARSFWLSKKPNRKRALKLHVVRPKSPSPGGEGRGEGATPHVEFEVFPPKSDAEVPKGTVARANATCPACGIVLPAPRVREQLTAQRGGADVVFDENGSRIGGARLMAIVTTTPGQQGRNYRVAEARDYEAVRRAMAKLAAVESHPLPNGLSPVPAEPLPYERQRGNSGFRVLIYGIATHGDLFSARQKTALSVLSSSVAQLVSDVATRTAMAAALNRVAMSDMSLTRWNAYAEKMQHTFGRQALPMVWDFAEVVPIAEAPGNWQSGYELAAAVASSWPDGGAVGIAEQADAAHHPLGSESADVWFTDPPYYDAIAYADLSDFFLVWLRRTLGSESARLGGIVTDDGLASKDLEITQDNNRYVDGHAKDRRFFENGMAAAFREGRRCLRETGIASVVFAHKTTEGWEALLSGMISGGWVITGSWPISTEMGSRLNAQDSAALATSVHLVCRPRPEDAPIGDWGEILRELPTRIGDWMERLSREGVRGADLVFACIGPALELYSKHPRVETPEGRPVDLAEFLEKVWEVVGRSALEQVLGTAEAQARNGNAGALEEDSRLTALFLWTLQATNGESGSNRGDAEDAEEDEEEGGSGKRKAGFRLIYDVVRRFAQPLGIHLEDWEDRIIETEKGVVRLLPIAERAKALFGEEGASAMAAHIEAAAARGEQMSLFGDEHSSLTPTIRGRGRSSRSGSVGEVRREATTLDRVHAAMLLQRSGRAAALRALIDQELDRGPDFVRLANALSALYPKDSEEKRLVDAMLLGVRR